MSNVIAICAGLVGPKSGNVEKGAGLQVFLKGSTDRRLIQESEQPSEPEHFVGNLGPLVCI